MEYYFYSAQNIDLKCAVLSCRMRFKNWKYFSNENLLKMNENKSILLQLCRPSHH